jgi:hypothetical protein
MERQIGPVWIGGGVILALAVAAVSTAALKLLATPSDYGVRLAAVEQKVTRAERLAAAPGDSAAYPKGAVCEGVSDSGFEKVRQGLDQAAAEQGLQALQVAWGTPIDAGARVAPLPFSLRVEGPYEKVVTFMDRLSRGAPMIFVDAADVTASGLGAQLTLSGKVFCWTRG